MERVKVGDLVQMKKQHACGYNEWKVTRAGADVKIMCTNCGRTVMLDRPKFIKSIKRRITNSNEDR